LKVYHYTGAANAIVELNANCAAFYVALIQAQGCNHSNGETTSKFHLKKSSTKSIIG
jgi:hypothetical protein